MGSTMKLHQFARAAFFDHHEPSLSLGCSKRLRPLAPKSATTISAAPFDLKSFIRPESGPRKLGSNPEKRDLPPQVETHPGGTRWNPTQEQIGILEMLYRGGMRTPNALQIEQITGQLGKYGKIEGKNVFYWFQNHKARERQKQKRNNLGLNRSTRSPATPTTVAAATSSITSSLTLESKGEMFVRGGEEDSPFKRKCTSWSFESLEGDRRSCRNEGDGTLQLFPLHPEKR